MASEQRRVDPGWFRSAQARQVGLLALIGRSIAGSCANPLPGEIEGMLTLEKVIVLKAVKIFSSLPDEFLAAIADRLVEVDLGAGETFIAQGEVGSSMYVIATGRVRVHVGEMTIVEFGEREVVGELAALDPEPRSASVTTLEDSVLYRLEHEDLDDILAADVDVSRGIIQMLVQRIRQATATSTAASAADTPA